MPSLKGRDLIETQELTTGEINHLLDLAKDLKDKFRRGEPASLLPNQTVYLLCFDEDTRTRAVFETGATQLGAHAVFLDGASSRAMFGTSGRETGITLGSMGHAIAVRHSREPCRGNRFMHAVAEATDVPVFNLGCDVDHPIRTLADLMTIREVFGDDLRGRKLVVSWACSSSIIRPRLLPQGLITLMTRFGMDLTLAHPPEFRLTDRSLEAARKNAESAGTRFKLADGMEEAVENADIVYAGSWGPQDLLLEREGAAGEEEIHTAEERYRALGARYRHWICDGKKMELARHSAITMHVLPADRGAEVTDEVLDGPHSVVHQQAENLLHMAKAIMAATMRERPFK